MTNQREGSIFTRRLGVHFQPSLTPQPTQLPTPHTPHRRRPMPMSPPSDPKSQLRLCLWTGRVLRNPVAPQKGAEQGTGHLKAWY